MRCHILGNDSLELPRVKPRLEHFTLQVILSIIPISYINKPNQYTLNPIILRNIQEAVNCAKFKQNRRTKRYREQMKHTQTLRETFTCVFLHRCMTVDNTWLWDFVTWLSYLWAAAVECYHSATTGVRLESERECVFLYLEILYTVDLPAGVKCSQENLWDGKFLKRVFYRISTNERFVNLVNFNRFLKTGYRDEAIWLILLSVH